ncbi:ribose-phosphate pyrophosphokinase [Mycobacterium phage Bromden]|uniref:ribose-phosphate diphosphokinase n=1 Tax=Mycobacterium phage Bromden TaxID=2283252 RepID=A0A345MBK8_9CAUD|nr:ribose-phosphate pyrophosphokinase [Mycobacterium phage Bromden]AXH67879.1 phosphoribosyl pyrophosphate transferase [Mycobacterium phage Bromden]
MAVHLRAYNEKLGTVRDVAVPFQFPGGEWDLKNVHEFDNRVTWVADVRGADLNDLMAAALLSNVAVQRGEDFVLMVPYLPAARADRGHPTGCVVYADLLAAMHTTNIITVDPHSYRMPDYLRATAGAVAALDPLPLLDRALESQGHWRYDAIIAPDKGAVDRAGAIAKHYGLDLVVCDKERDFDTGRITKYRVPILSTKGKYLVVDDICDGGGTFALLASEALISKPNLDLWVTHGIFSGKATMLPSYYGRIMTTDSHPGHNRVGVATSIVPTFTYMHETMVKGLSDD